MPHVYIFLTVFFTVYGQLVIKWQVNAAGMLPEKVTEKFSFIFSLLLNPWIITGLLSAFLASLFWMAAMTKFPISYAYPFTSLAFVLVVFLGAVFFNEPITWPRVVGLTSIVAGIVISSQR
jgi:multidrug transporter EmrE-like cation transporter